MQRKYNILIHTIFWFIMLLLVGLETIPSFGKLTYSIIAADYIIYIIFFFVIFYSFYFCIKKEHLNKKRIRALIIFGLMFIVFITVPTGFIYILILDKEVLNLSGNAFILQFTKYCISFLETSFLFGMSGALMKIALLWYDNVMKQKEMEKQLFAGELALLRSQINPQFLFNTLTSIRTLIEQKPDKAIYSIENLSEIMSYMLYETSAEKVFLDDEIDNINNYLNLQRVWYNPDFISIEVAEDTNGLKVPPLIFMPFIENVFTYGDTSPRTPGIKISLKVTDKTLSFDVMSYAKGSKEETVIGFSMQSMKRRLDLLFGNNYTIEMKSEGNNNLIKLNITDIKGFSI
jgi:two-component system, LytTR family, sensor kinase